MSEILKSYESYMLRKPVARDDGECLVLTTNGQDYEIDWQRCCTSAQVMGWILHLSPKQWMTARHISELIEAASKKFPAIEVQWP